ncbi:MAG: hypothetical protein DCC49_04425 [Acidobacteria bacterium]|nr:MAG: hypothetical protein DCC49_04425 [Acidobacteriota bacterium]
MTEDGLPSIAVIGLGSIGVRHAGNFQSLGCQVIGADSDPGRLQMLDRFPEAAAAANIDDAIERSDAVVIATPASSHIPIAAQALSAGRHLLIEKPLSTDLSGSDQLEDPADSIVMTGFNLRFLPAVGKAKTLIDDGAIGRILNGSFEFGYDLRKWNPHRDYRKTYSARVEDGGGVLLDAIHELDLLLHLCGAADSVIATLGSSGLLEIDGEDRVVAAVTIEGGGILQVALDYLSPTYYRGFRIVGDEGLIEWDWNTGTMNFIRGDARAQFHWNTDADATYVEEARHFLACIAEGQVKPPAADIAAGISSLELAMAIRESDSESARVFLGETPDE